MSDQTFRRASAYRKWFFRGLRLSLVVGVLAAAANSWIVFSRFAADRDQALERQRGYECASKKPDDLLRANANEYGNINIRRFFCSDRDFFVSMPELIAVRAGQLEFKPTLKPTDPMSMMVVGIGAMLATILGTGALLAGSMAVNWVWGGRA